MSQSQIKADEIPFGGPKHIFRRIGEGHYRLTIEEHGIEFDVDRLWRDKHELSGELLVTCSIAGARTFNGCLSSGNFNLSSTRGRQEHARRLRDKARTADGVDWESHLEELCLSVLQEEREGQPARPLREYAKPSPDDTYDVAGITILKRHPQMFFGDGGTFKSYLGLYIAGLLAVRGVRVLYADWELAGEDHRDRLERLFGPEMPDLLWYHRCERPMVAEADSLRRKIEDLGIEFMICDSVAYASSGAPESAEVAAEYFRAVRQFGERIGSLHIAHVTKPKDDDNKAIGLKPFGSVFWHNSARATWYVKRADDTADNRQITIGLYNQKANLGPLRGAVGLQIAFGSDRTEVQRIDLADVADLAAGLPLWRRCANALKHGPQTIHYLAEELNAKSNSIERALKRSDMFTRVPTSAEDGIHRWGLAEQRVA